MQLVTSKPGRPSAGNWMFPRIKLAYTKYCTMVGTIYLLFLKKRKWQNSEIDEIPLRTFSLKVKL